MRELSPALSLPCWAPIKSDAGRHRQIPVGRASPAAGASVSAGDGPAVLSNSSTYSMGPSGSMTAMSVSGNWRWNR